MFRSFNLPASAADGAPQIAWPGYDEFTIPLDPRRIRVMPEQMQFKSDTDKRGVNNHLSNVQVWDPAFAGVAVVFRDRDGIDFVADGHQRHDTALRIGLTRQGRPIMLNCIVLKEADGWTAPQARLFAAYKNIAEDGPTTTAIDVAQLFRDAPADSGSQDFLRSWLPTRSASLHEGRELAKLNDEAFDLIRKKIARPSWGVYIAQTIQGDPEIQLAILQTLVKAKPRSDAEMAEIVGLAVEAGFVNVRQETLFGDTEVKDSLVPERILIVRATCQMLGSQQRAVCTLNQQPHFKFELGLDTPRHQLQETIDNRAQQIELLKRQAHRGGEISDCLSQLARQLKAGSISQPRAAQSLSALLSVQVAAICGTRRDEDLVRDNSIFAAMAAKDAPLLLM